MPEVCWEVSPNGSYWIDVAVGNCDCPLMIDLGLVDPRDEIGLVLEPTVYDQLRRDRQVTRLHSRLSRDASGHYWTAESGFTRAQLIDPDSRQCVGAAVYSCVSRGAPGVPSRAGVVFFHGLGGKVVWHLSDKVWCVEYA